MNRRLQMSRAAFALFAALALTIPGLGLNCPGGGAPLDPPLTDENRAPRMLITEVITPSGDGNAEQGLDRGLV